MENISLYEKLPYKEELQAWLNAYAGYEKISSKAQPADLKYLMRIWDKNKKELYHLLGDQFIYSVPYEYEIDADTLVDNIREKVVWGDGEQFVQQYDNWVNENFPSSDNYPIFRALRRLVRPTVLANNVYEGSSVKFSINGTTLAIPYGCKPSKILGKIAALADLDGYEKFRIAHSMVLNHKKVMGKLCLSIHPLDYFTMSDNDCNWESCMNWRNDGCYRAGTVEMCNSPYVIVAYLCSNSDIRFYNYTWNNKKWRNLFIFSKDIITSVKDYPYYNQSLNDFCIQTLRKLAKENLGYDYEPTVYKHEWGYSYDNHFEANEVFWSQDEEFELEFTSQFMYNDFTNNACSNFIVRPGVREVSIHYSGLSECMFCGGIIADRDELEDERYVICRDCLSMRPLEHCHCCGREIEEDTIYTIDGECLCYDCFERRVCVDDFTLNMHLKENCYKLYIIPDVIEFKASDFSLEKFEQANFPYVMVNRNTPVSRYLRDGSEVKYAFLTSENPGGTIYRGSTMLCQVRRSDDIFYVYRNSCPPYVLAAANLSVSNTDVPGPLVF